MNLIWSNRSRKTFSLLVCLIALSYSRATPVRDTATQQLKPLWTADLRAFGYDDGPSPRLFVAKTNNGIVFAGSYVIAYFVTRSPDLTFASRDPHQSSANFRLHAVFLDAESGAPLFAKDWSTRIVPSGILPTKRGNLIVRTGDLLSLYSPKFDLLAERSLPIADTWATEMSPNGRVLWLWNIGTHSLEKLDADSFKVSDSGVSDGIRSEPSFSDQEMLTTKLVKHQSRGITFAQELAEVRTLGTDWHAIYLPGRGGCGGVDAFVSDTRIISGRCGSIDLISNTGEMLMRDGIDKKQSVDRKTAASFDGNAAAVSVHKTKGGTFDITPMRRSTTTIILYNLEEMKRLGVVNVDPVPETNYDFAVSPDGKMLAIMSDATVKIYTLTANPKPSGKTSLGVR